MYLFLFIVFSTIYIMIVHFAFDINDEFNLFLMIGLFFLGGTVGYLVNSYEMGFGGAIILSLVFL